LRNTEHLHRLEKKVKSLKGINRKGPKPKALEPKVSSGTQPPRDKNPSLTKSGLPKVDRMILYGKKTYGIHNVEPQPLPPDILDVKKKKYNGLVYASRSGFPTPNPRYRITAEVAKRSYDYFVGIFLQCKNVATFKDLKAAKGRVSESRRFIQRHSEFFANSRFVLQIMKAISITLRFSECDLRSKGFSLLRAPALRGSRDAES